MLLFKLRGTDFDKSHLKVSGGDGAKYLVFGISPQSGLYCSNPITVVAKGGSISLAAPQAGQHNLNFLMTVKRLP